MTVEISHGKPRLTAPRLSDLESVDTAAERSRNHNADGTFAPRNEAARGRRAKAAVTRPLREARRRVQEAIARAVEPSEADRLTADAWAIYVEARRDVGHRSILVLTPAVIFASNTILAGYFKNAATAAGLTSEEAERLLGLAHNCEQQAFRASTAMLANAKALGSAKPKRNPILDVVDAAGRSDEP